jgi:hypothetical protein
MLVSRPTVTFTNCSSLPRAMVLVIWQCRDVPLVLTLEPVTTEGRSKDDKQPFLHVDARRKMRVYSGGSVGPS